MIKTKFDQVVKLKKMKVDEVQNSLLSLNKEILSKKDKISSLNQELSNIKYPENGNFSMIMQIREMMKLEMIQIQKIETEILDLENRKESLNIELKEKQVDYEKMKYLQGEEVKQFLIKLKKKEAKDMDEIAVMLYKGE